MKLLSMVEHMKQHKEWAVVGAGPAGIASIGKLFDAGVTPQEIIWIDPHFKAGDFGNHWRHVSSNTSVEYFLKFYQDCETFHYQQPGRETFMIDKIAPNLNCPLMIAAQPLHWISKMLLSRVNSYQDSVTQLTPINHHWQLALASGQTIEAQKIILAIGANAKELKFANVTTIPLSTALTPAKLKIEVQAADQICVFGSAQSAKSVVENLSKNNFKKGLLFYRSEHSLERHLHDTDLSAFETLEATSSNFLKHIPNCNKAIYAIGFERRHIPILGLPENYSYHHKTGEIAPGIFGLGIAFPEIKPYELGQQEYPVTAIWPFMKRLKKLLPLWLNAQ